MADQSSSHTFFAWGSLNYGESLFGEFSLKRRFFRAEPEPPKSAPATPERRQQWVEEEQEFNERLQNLSYRFF
jgi:hypothetical protein